MSIVPVFIDVPGEGDSQLDQAGAETLIAGADLILGDVVVTYSARVSQGYVISQAPEAGRQVPMGALISFSISLGPAPWNPGPVAHLAFDEGSGVTAYDSSGFGNDGEIFGASWYD